MAPRLVLQRRREDLCISREKLAAAVGVDPRTCAHWEEGTHSPRLGLRPRLAKELRWSLAQLSAALNGELMLNGQDVPGWLDNLAAYEQSAGQIWAFEAMVVHGLLQTEAYAAAVERADLIPLSDEAIARGVEVRMARQHILTREPHPVRLSVVLDESILLRQAGSDEVMAAQLAHLINMAARPNVTVQVLQLNAGRFSAAFGAFKVFARADTLEPHVACVEDRNGAHYLDRAHDIDAHVSLFSHLTEVSLSPEDSVQLIKRRKERFE